MTNALARSRISDTFLNVLRIVTGLMFMQHGAQKLFGVFGFSHPVALASLFGVAGVLEFFGGMMIVLGLFTRPVAFVLAGEMAVAYFRAHFPAGWIPIVNRGELAVLYCFIYLYLAANDGGSFSLDGWIARRRRATGAGDDRG
jgi:putative oxidoreductase